MSDVKEVKFTPGPWAVTFTNYPIANTGYYGEYVYVSDANEMVILEMFDPERGSEANLHLIAAAPDLYAACEKAMLACQDNLKMYQYKNELLLAEAFDDCKAALAKARGEA